MFCSLELFYEKEGELSEVLSGVCIIPVFSYFMISDILILLLQVFILLRGEKECIRMRQFQNE